MSLFRILGVLGSPKARVAVLAVLGLAAALVLAPAAHAAGGTDLFSKLTDTVATVSKAIAGALMIVGALITGGSIIAGSQHAGLHAKNFFLGAAFLGLVAFGAGLYALVAGWYGMGQ